jgi:hypothetical protein
VRWGTVGYEATIGSLELVNLIRKTACQVGHIDLLEKKTPAHTDNMRSLRLCGTETNQTTTKKESAIETRSVPYLSAKMKV